MIVTVIDTTGEIVSVLNVPDEATAQLNTPQGCSIIDGSPTYPSGYWNGTTWVDRPHQPNSYDTWDATQKQWVDPRTLSQAQNDQWALVKAARNTTIYSGFVWNNFTFDSDPDAQQFIIGAVVMAMLAQQNNESFSVNWVLQDNQVHTLNAQDMINVGLGLGAFVQAQINQGASLYTQIMAATTVADVVAITWTPAS
jgi:hypothetical protein